MQARVHASSLSHELIHYHKVLTPYLWSVIIDLAIFLPFLVQFKYSLVTHMILGGLVGILSIGTAYPSMIRGLPPTNSRMYFHKLFGFIIFGLIIAELSLGLISYLIKPNKNTSPHKVLYTRWGHTFLGYAIAIMSKVQCILIIKSGSQLYWFSIIWNSILIVLYIKRQLTHLKIESASPKQLKNAYYLQSSNNFQSADPSQQIKIIFGNDIYDGRNVANNHPGGKDVVLAIKAKCVERYLYGIEALQSFPDLPLYSHSAQSIVLLGSPIAKIKIKMPYRNFERPSYQVKGITTSTVCEKPRVDVVLLKLESQKKIQFSGYSGLEQLGRYYALTNAQGVTRLYSVVNFLHKKNQRFTSKCLSKITAKSLVQLKTNFLEEKNHNEQLEGVIAKHQNDESVIPLLLKVYEDGRFTKDFTKKIDQKMIVTEAKGRGLALNEVAKGTVVLIGGGTGLYPYCDLIDLLFKKQIIQIASEFERETLQQNPILRNECFEGFKFIFMMAVNSIAQIHAITKEQLFFLVENNKAELKIKVKQECSLPILAQRLSATFGQTLKRVMKSSNVTKVYVCGPSRMCQELNKTFQDLKFQNYSFL